MGWRSHRDPLQLWPDLESIGTQSSDHVLNMQIQVPSSFEVSPFRGSRIRWANRLLGRRAQAEALFFGSNLKIQINNCPCNKGECRVRLIVVDQLPSRFIFLLRKSVSEGFEQFVSAPSYSQESRI